MKELTIEQKAKAYGKVREKITLRFGSNVTEEIFSEFEMSEDEKIRKQILSFLKEFAHDHYRSLDFSSWIAWLEKQGEPIDEEKVLIGARKDVAMSIMNYLDDKSVGMCLSEMERKDIEDALINSKWNKLYNYMKKKLEKQGEQKPAKNIIETWKDMRLEVYQQASGNRHEPNYSDDTTKMFSLNDIDEIIEKVSEQKPVDKVESEFNVGDWITFCGGNPFKILKVEQEQSGILDYLLLDQKGRESYYNKRYVDENARLWTIQDAKDGDILAAHECYVIFKEINGLNIKCYCTYHYMGFNPSFRVDTLQNKDAFYPATKEQCDALMKAMTDVGYEWDAEKKELKKLGNEIEIPSDTNSKVQEVTYCIPKGFYAEINDDKVVIKRGENPAWSEEDIRCIKLSTDIIDSALRAGFCVQLDRDRCVDWFKSIKERVQPKQEWSEEDEEMRIYACKFLDDAKQIDYPVPHKEDIDKCISWIKSFKQK